MRQRIAAVAVLFAVVFSALALRVVQLTTVQGGALKQRADRQHHTSVRTTTSRGTLSRRETVLIASGWPANSRGRR